MLEARAEALGRRGQRIEERNATRDLVFWDPRALEAVMQVAAQRRLITADDSNPGWAATLRQWWARLEFVSGRWWIVDQRDLTPDTWRPVVKLTGWVGTGSRAAYRRWDASVARGGCRLDSRFSSRASGRKPDIGKSGIRRSARLVHELLGHVDRHHRHERSARRDEP